MVLEHAQSTLTDEPLLESALSDHLPRISGSRDDRDLGGWGYDAVPCEAEQARKMSFVRGMKEARTAAARRGITDNFICEYGGLANRGALLVFPSWRALHRQCPDAKLKEKEPSLQLASFFTPRRLVLLLSVSLQVHAVVIERGLGLCRVD